MSTELAIIEGLERENGPNHPETINLHAVNIANILERVEAKVQLMQDKKKIRLINIAEPNIERLEVIITSSGNDNL